MTYTARLNAKIALPSGNWFSGFKTDAESRTVIYTYHDRRRNGQVARHYTVTFKADLSTVGGVTAVSAHGGRVEHFKTVSIRDDLAIILRAAVREAWEKSFADEVEQVEPESTRIAFNPSAVLFFISIALFLIAVVGVVVCGITDNDVIAQVAAGVSFCSFVCAVLCSARFHA